MSLSQALFILFGQAITVLSLAIDTSSTNLLTNPTSNNINLNFTQPSLESAYNITPPNNTQPLSLIDRYIPCNATTPPLRPAEPTACTYATQIACRLLSQTTFPRITKGRWVWSNASGCSVAFYVPVSATSVLIPPLGECRETFENIAHHCAGRPVENVGSVNVRTFPSRRDPGSAFDGARVRYLVASMQF